MSIRFSLIAAAFGLVLSFGTAHAARSRQTMGGAFERKAKPEKKSAPSPTEWSPEDRKRLMGEVSGSFYAEAVKAKSAGKLSEAQTLFERVLILNPNNTAARGQLNDIKRKLEAASKAQKTSSKSSSARLLSKLWNEADSAARHGHWDDARAGYRKILAVDPANKKAKARLAGAEAQIHARLKKRGEEREKAGDAEGAIDAYQLALLHGDDAAVETRIARLRKRVSETNRKKSDGIYAEALNASQKGNNEKARGLCRQALRIDPSNLQAQRMLERLERRPR